MVARGERGAAGRRPPMLERGVHPTTPERGAARHHAGSPNVETERLRRRFGMSRRGFVRTAAAMAVGFWAIDTVSRPRLGNYGWADNTATHRRVRPRVGWPGRSGDALQPARRVHLRRPDPSRRRGRSVAGRQPGHPCVLRRGLAAGVAVPRRPAQHRARRISQGRRRRRTRPDRQPVAVPLPEGAVPRLGDVGDRAVVRARPRRMSTTRCRSCRRRRPSGR